MEATIRLEPMTCVIFRLDALRYGVRLASVVRVLPAVEITPLPKAPLIVMGVINLGGRIIAVVNMRRRFGLPERELELTDQLLIATTSGTGRRGGERRMLALVVDEVVGVLDLSAQETAAGVILPGLEHLHGVAKTPEGLVLVHDLDTFLSLEEEGALATSLEGEST